MLSGMEKLQSVFVNLSGEKLSLGKAVQYNHTISCVSMSSDIWKIINCKYYLRTAFKEWKS